MKRFLLIVLSLAMLFSLAITATAATYTYDAYDEYTAPDGALILKGTPPGDFLYEGWNNVFDLANGAVEDVTYWHFVNVGGSNADPKAATEMVLLFNENDEFVWTPDMGWSTNEGGNNTGWVVKTPSSWELKGGYLLGTGKNFNLSNFVDVPGDDTDPFGTISFSVYKELGEYAAAYFAANPELALPEFTFELTLLVDGVPYAGEVDTSAKTIKAGESAVWGPFEFDKTVTVSYAITEIATAGYVQVGEAVVQATKNNGIVTDTGIIEIAPDDIIEIDYAFTNEFVFGNGETAAAFSAEEDSTDTFGIKNKAWHFVSFNASDEFVVLAGQHYQIGTGKIVNGVPVITWAPGVKVFDDDMSYAFAAAVNAIKLADTAPGQLAAGGKNGFGTHVYADGCFVKIHVNVEIPELLYPVLDIRN